MLKHNREALIGWIARERQLSLTLPMKFDDVSGKPDPRGITKTLRTVIEPIFDASGFAVVAGWSFGPESFLGSGQHVFDLARKDGKRLVIPYSPGVVDRIAPFILKQGADPLQRELRGAIIFSVRWERLLASGALAQLSQPHGLKNFRAVYSRNSLSYIRHGIESDSSFIQVALSDRLYYFSTVHMFGSSDKLMELIGRLN